MGNPDSGCRRHPNQKQLPGVCSFCLRERLSKLSSENNSYKTSSSAFSDSSSPSSSPPYSAASSVALADRRRSNHHRRNESEASAPLGFVLHQGSSSGLGDVTAASGLKKSKSVAWAPRTAYRVVNGNGIGKMNRDEEKEKDEKSGKKGGLWKKLIHSTSKKTKGVLMHSMTVKERSRKF